MNMNYLIDSHCHLHDREFFEAEQAEKMLENAKENNVKQIVCIGTSIEDSLEAKKFAEKHENVFWTFGVHPEYAKNLENFSSILKDNIDENLVAIGEVGLDYHYEPFDRNAQIKLFEEMLQLAKNNDLPVCFHIREAFPDFFGVISNFPKIKGVVHSFTDSKKNLKKILETTDFYVGVNGLATYSTLPLPPLERIVLETDAPFLTPAPFRGIINESAYVKNIADWLSTKLGVSSEEIAEKTTENVRKVYKLPNPEL